jgi:hypothetical protein
MYNWSVDTRRLEKNPRAGDIFRLEQAINYGLNDQKLSAKKLRRYWDELEIDDGKRKYLKKLLWPQGKK